MLSPTGRPRAAAAVLRMQGKEILLVKHRWRDGTTSWILPGGALLPGETPEEAALRELYEETGLNGKITRFLFTIPYTWEHQQSFSLRLTLMRRWSWDTTQKRSRKNTKC